MTNYDANARSEFHAGSSGHTTKNCMDFKYKVQELADAKLLTFKENGPNVKTNSLFGHPGPTVNAIEEAVGTDVIKEVGSIQTLMWIICEKLIEAGLIKKIHGICEVCLSSLKECKDLKRCIQKLIA